MRWLLSLLVLVATLAQAEPVKPTWDYTKFTLEIVFLSDREVADKCASLGAWGGNVKLARSMSRDRPIGCAATYHDTKRCVVYVTKPETLNDARTLTLGHEVLHCALGEYHEEGLH